MFILGEVGRMNVNCKTNKMNLTETEKEINDAKNALDVGIAEEKEEIIEEILDELSTSDYWNSVLSLEEQKEVANIEDTVSKLDSDEASEKVVEVLESIESCEEVAELLEQELDINSIEDFEKQPLINSYTGEELTTVEDVKLYLEKTKHDVDETTYIMYKTVEKQKENNNEVSLTKLVKEINEQAEQLSTNSSFGICGTKVKASSLYTVAYSTWTTLTTEEKVLIALDPKKALYTKYLTDDAYTYTKNKFGYNGLGDKSDGFRHGVWNALMTRDLGRSWAKSYATAHESGKSSAELEKKAQDGKKEKYHQKMDLHNNEVGRSVIKWYDTSFNVSDKEVQNRIEKKLTNKKSTGIYWLHK